MSTFPLSSIPEHALVRLGALGEQMVRSRFSQCPGLPKRLNTWVVILPQFKTGKPCRPKRDRTGATHHHHHHHLVHFLISHMERRPAPSLGGAGAAQPQGGARREAALDNARGGAGEQREQEQVQGGRGRWLREQEQPRSSRSSRRRLHTRSELNYFFFCRSDERAAERGAERRGLRRRAERR